MQPTYLTFWQVVVGESCVKPLCLGFKRNISDDIPGGEILVGKSRVFELELVLGGVSFFGYATHKSGHHNLGLGAPGYFFGTKSGYSAVPAILAFWFVEIVITGPCLVGIVVEKEVNEVIDAETFHWETFRDSEKLGEKGIGEVKIADTELTQAVPNEGRSRLRFVLNGIKGHNGAAFASREPRRFRERAIKGGVS